MSVLSVVAFNFELHPKAPPKTHGRVVVPHFCRIRFGGVEAENRCLMTHCLKAGIYCDWANVSWRFSISHCGLTTQTKRLSVCQTPKEFKVVPLGLCSCGNVAGNACSGGFIRG